MRYRNLIFDLYGTLVDIHTEEDETVWEKTAFFFGFHGAGYTGPELFESFRFAMANRKAQAGQDYECYPDIPMEEVFAQLFRQKGVCDNAQELGIQALELFRISSLAYIRLYPGVLDALARLREKGFRLWLLSNAQAVCTRGELRLTGLDRAFDGIYLSSDYVCRKPDRRFFDALLQGEHLHPSHCLMIGNDRDTDIAGAKAGGLATLYLHTNLTPAEQASAAPELHPLISAGPHWEYEGADWIALSPILEELAW